MRPTFIIHVEGSTPHAIDRWTRPYYAQHVAAGQATRLVKNPSGTHKGDWVARIYRLAVEDCRGNCPKPPELTLVQSVAP